MIGVLALVGQKKSGRVDQGVEYAWCALPEDMSLRDKRLTQIQSALTARIEKVPSTYANSAALATIDLDQFKTLRLGCVATPGGRMAYIGLNSFAMIDNNPRGNTPFGLVFGFLVEDDCCQFHTRIVSEIKRLFDSYTAEARDIWGKVKLPVSDFPERRIGQSWNIAMANLVRESTAVRPPELATKPQPADLSVFIARQSEAATDIDDLVSKIEPLLQGEVDFDAFIALDTKLDRWVQHQSEYRLISYRTVDQFIHALRPSSIASPPSVPAPASYGAHGQQMSAPSDSLPPATRSHADFVLSEMATNIANLTAQLQDERSGRGGRTKRSTAMIVLAPLGIVGVIIALMLIPAEGGWWGRRPGDVGKAEELEALKHIQAKCLSRDKAIARSYAETGNGAWDLILKKGKEAHEGSDPKIAGLAIADANAFIAVAQQSAYDDIRKCLTDGS